MTRPLVVDASVLLAVLLEEPGARTAEPRLAGSLMSVVNLAEVLTRLDQRHLDPVEGRTLIRRLEVDLVPADEPLAFRAAHIHASTRDRGLSLADCFCLALAQERNAEVLTADRAWSRVEIGVPITVLSERSRP